MNRDEIAKFFGIVSVGNYVSVDYMRAPMIGRKSPRAISGYVVQLNMQNVHFSEEDPAISGKVRSGNVVWLEDIFNYRVLDSPTKPSSMDWMAAGE
jgi:hypothetical protein